MLHVVKKDSKVNRVGEVFQTNLSGTCTLISYVNSKSVIVQFADGTQVATNMSAVSLGTVKNPNAAGVLGVGIRGTESVISKEDKRIEHIWRSMLGRCYSDRNWDMGRSLTYEGCTVSDAFKHFSLFKAWYKAQVGAGSNFQLDKDLLGGNNKTYHEDHCLLVPREINMFLTTVRRKEGNCPVGVRQTSESRFRVTMTIFGVTECKGTYDTVDEAFNVYKRLKEDSAKVLAAKWYGKVDDRVYNALMTYSVNPDGTFSTSPNMHMKYLKVVAA